MAPKRRATVDSDSEDDLLQHSSPAAKRPRTSQPNATQAEAPILDAENEAKFEKDHEGAVMEQILGKKLGAAAVGGIAEMGIIESVEMINFMCHPFLTFKFGPQVNFIIGHNGSGKSAVLSAITVALGGKATMTGRGAGLKSFVREGKEASEVTISLKNQGEEAYKPATYGQSIVISRRFTKDGSSSYKIKSRDGKVISNKREELSAICDHMNIQVDNPMNILTQDSARQFLSASHAADKYRFFLKGTQLSQLSEEYETCNENIVQTDKILTRKREAIPDLEEAYTNARRKYEEANKAVEQKNKIEELNKELAWTHVAQKENEMKAAFGEVAKARAKLPRIQAELTKATAMFDEATVTVTQLEQQHHNIGDVQELHDQRKDVQVKINENKKILQGFQNDMRRIDQEVTNTDASIARLDKQIEDEARRMETHTREKRDEARAKLDQVQKDVDANDAHLKAVEADVRADAEQQAGAYAMGKQLDHQLLDAERDVRNCREQINLCDQGAQNSLTPYGERIGEVMAQVKTMKWHGGIPVGPLGLSVKLKDPKWADTMRIQLGSLMSAWAITDARDRGQLKALLTRSGNPQTTIIIAEVDLFDYSRGEPDPKYLTPLRVLDISDPYVLRILVNQRQIEKTYLALRREEGDDILLSVGGGNAWTADFYNVTRFKSGGGTSTPSGGVQGRAHHLFPGNDKASTKRNWVEKLAIAEATLKEIQRKYAEHKAKFSTIAQSKERMQRQAAQIHTNGLRLKSALQQLQAEANEELPAGIAGFQVMKDEFEAEKRSFREQFDDIAKRKAEIEEMQRPLVNECTALKRQIDSFEETKSDLASKITNAAANRMQIQANQNHWRNKIEADEAQIAKLQQVADVNETEFKEWTEMALKISPRVPANRSLETVQRNLESVQRALKEREKRQGASVEEIQTEMARTKLAYQSARRDIQTMVALNKDLHHAVNVRLQRWHDFRRHIALRCKVFFQYNLSNRGYFGKVLFDHHLQTLQLRVQTEDTGGQQAREKDPKALSGGEKSFSTICLLLALWESIGCPIRCLDEFDVFMDAVNRRISMKMMTETAKASDGKQYVLITPQDMQGLQIEAHVRIHRMSDPERGQGTLAF